MGRREHVWALDVLARCRVDEPSAFPSGSFRLLLRSGGTWLRSILLFLCSVCSLPSLALGYPGSNCASRYRCSGMGSLRIFTTRDLYKPDLLLRFCADTYGCNCCLRRLGKLVVDGAATRISRCKMNKCGRFISGVLDCTFDNFFEVRNARAQAGVETVFGNSGGG